MTRKAAITQKDVARKAGVSRSVVSYVINNGPREVAEETRKRVLNVIKELGYQPNKFAQGLKWGDSKASKSLGIIAGGQSYNVLERPYYNMILSGLFEEAHKLGLDVRFFSFFEALLDPVFFNRNIHPDEISSLISDSIFLNSSSILSLWIFVNVFLVIKIDTGLISIPIAFLPARKASPIITPLPQKGSKTISDSFWV